VRTRADLVNRVAKFLGKLVAGQSLSAEDFASIDDEIQSVVDNLNARGVTYISDVDNIEEAVFLPLARIITTVVATDFSVPLNSLVGFVGPTPATTEPRKSELELRTLGRTVASSDDVVSFKNF
jgi:hypothetical protein